ncbi:MAG: tRNA (adenosine(37)-N6)-threonylcarbamoyltransferase complex dimerization subunit type 1 TsaB [Acutalibacter sp.]
MLTLGIDSSAAAASAAVVEDGKVLGEYYVNTKQTHSQTLLPMVQGLLETLGRSCGEMDVLAVSHGPGSFTGVRIGVACVKGIAFPNNIPCVGVSTLEAIAWGGAFCEGAVLCAVMDARCGQVYNGVFQVREGALQRLQEDRALSIDALEQEVQEYGENLLLLGDGAELCYQRFQAWGARLAPEPFRFQRASSVALLGEAAAKAGNTVSAGELAPVYLRLPQAERELKARLAQKKL